MPDGARLLGGSIAAVEIGRIYRVVGRVCSEGGGEGIGGEGMQISGGVGVDGDVWARAGVDVEVVVGVVVERLLLWGLLRVLVLVLVLALVVEVAEVVEQRAGARNRLVSKTAMVHGVAGLVPRPRPITRWRWRWQLRAGWLGLVLLLLLLPLLLLLCTRLWSEQDLRTPEIIDVPCG